MGVKVEFCNYLIDLLYLRLVENVADDATDLLGAEY
jgi:hypothetical protein